MKNLANTAVSVLDLAVISEGKEISDTFVQLTELARLVESLGYTRYWLAEHHNIAGIASAATSILIGYVAQNTKTIRVGSGGIMLPNHSPLIIAEQFGTLETLYPNRIDLGLGRAPGTDQLTMQAIRRGVAQEFDFGDLIDELLFYFAKPARDQKVRAVPGAGIHVPLYILGSSLYSAQLAARLGRPYAFAGHFAPAAMLQAFDIYRSNFQPSQLLKKPYVMVGVPVIAAETDDHAKYLATSVQQIFLGMVRGNRKLLAPPVDDIDKIWTPQEKAAVNSMLGLLVIGGRDKVRQQLDQLIESTQADELIISTGIFEHAYRMKSYAIVSQAKLIGK